MKVSVIGSGAVGAATGRGLSQSGHDVIFYDIDAKRLAELEAEGCTVVRTFDEVDGCDIHFICVPTPVPDRDMDLSMLEAALTGLAQAMTEQKEYVVVAVRSTVIPFTTRNRLFPIFKQHCALKPGEHYGICHNPEFMREAHALDDFLNPPVNVIGTDDEKTANVMKRLYASFKATLLVTTPENAEAIKIVSNVYNTGKVSFFNQIYLIAEKLGLDHEVISQALTRASLGVRVPEYYTRGGSAFGGKCLPKDLMAFTGFLREQGLETGLFDEVWKINEVMKRLEPEQ